MLRNELREKVVAKLANARSEIEDALSFSTPAARYDPVVMHESTRNKLLACSGEVRKRPPIPACLPIWTEQRKPHRADH